MYDPTSFTKAKTVVYRLLREAAGTNDGQNSFLGFLPPIFDAWGITFGGGGDVLTAKFKGPPRELRLHADIEGVYREQETADETGMKLLGAMAITHVRSDGAPAASPPAADCLIQYFAVRDGGQLDVFLDYRKIGNENAGKPVLLWIMKIGCQLVFNTHGGAG